jgi:hypothetical protein
MTIFFYGEYSDYHMEDTEEAENVHGENDVEVGGVITAKSDNGNIAQDSETAASKFRLRADRLRASYTEF